MFEGLQKPPNWMSKGLCASHPMPDLWWYDYPHRSKTEERKQTIVKISIALEYCEECPVKKQCLLAGLEQENLQTGSIWGGLLFTERQALATRKSSRSGVKENWIKTGIANLKRQRAKVE